MPRIRSIHPGQWTDEAFVSCSPMARLLGIALRNIADDQGVFEWKPLGLKMQIFPGDNADMPALLAELSASDQIREFEVSAKPYGAIRNFRRWQRPEKPKALHPLPESLRQYVGLSPTAGASGGGGSSNGSGGVHHQSPTSRRQEPLLDEGRFADQSPTDHRNPIQREEEGGRREEDTSSLRSEGAPRVAPPLEIIDARTALFRSGLTSLSRLTGKPEDASRKLLGRWLKANGDDCARIHRAIDEATAMRPADPVAWLNRAVAGRSNGFFAMGEELAANDDREPTNPFLALEPPPHAH